MRDKPRVLIRGGGDLASGVAARLHRVGFNVLVVELAHPLVVRRLVSFAEAVFSREVQVEEITGRLAADMQTVEMVLAQNKVAVMVDPDLNCLDEYNPLILVDARMRKMPPERDRQTVPLVIGLGPGFTAGENCHAVIETMRGHRLGRVIWQGSALPNTGIPDMVAGKSSERVLRAPVDGLLRARVEIGSRVKAGEILASVEGEDIIAPFQGVMRGLLQNGLSVQAGQKIGDLDPRDEPEYAHLISDKALAIAGGVLEAIFSQEEIRKKLYAPD